MRGHDGDLVLDASFKGIPLGTRTRLADLATRRWNVPAGDLSLPVMTLDRDAVEDNIAAMAAYCRRHGARLAPHGKTTMSAQLFRRQLAAGAWAITAATPTQAWRMRESGIQRILLANELTDPAALRWLAGEYRRDPDFELLFLVDHPAAVRLADEVLTAAPPGRKIPVLIELGARGPAGRTGVRTAAAAIALAEQVTATATLALAGVETYEGVVASEAAPADFQAVDALLTRAAGLARILHQRGLADGGELLLSAGGSIYFDRVIAAFAPLRAELPGLQIVLRSGGYLSHDAGRHRRLSPLAGRRAAGEQLVLREALTLWSSVLSVPEPGRVIAGAGKRDAPYDVELPVPRRLYQAGAGPGSAPAELAGARVVKLMDQHALVDVDPAQPVAPGDIMTFGVSHPCAAFDRWRFLPLLDADGTVVDGVVTSF
jgi:D-serine dehydratase